MGVAHRLPGSKTAQAGLEQGRGKPKYGLIQSHCSRVSLIGSGGFTSASRSYIWRMLAHTSSVTAPPVVVGRRERPERCPSRPAATRIRVFAAFSSTSNTTPSLARIRSGNPVSPSYGVTQRVPTRAGLMWTRRQP